jgi:hypothetical protein
MVDNAKHLNKEDLYLLMESYRNMIQMHSTLVDQQKRIIHLQNNIMEKQNGISENQIKTCNQLDGITDKLEDCSVNLAKTNENITGACTDLDKSLTSNVGNIHEKLGNNQLEITKQHSGINNRIYVAMGIMATIVIGVTTLAIGLLDERDLIQEISQVMQQVLIYLEP